ncbi:MAG: APC family permease [Bryobacteraceae bacterium]
MTTARPPAQLLRQLGVISATALVVSNMVGTGIFTSTGFFAGDIGSVGLIMVLWIVGAICALTGAFVYSELGINYPSSGGEYVYLTRAFGPTWGFLTGWISFFAGFSAPIAAAALAFSDYLGYFWPALKQENAIVTFTAGTLNFRLGGAQLAASALIALFTVANFFGVRRIAWAQNILTSTKILVLVAFVLLGFTIGTGSWDNFSQPAVRTSSASLPVQFAISMFFIYLSYSGWNAATYVAEELKEPKRTLPLALALGTAGVAVLYLLLNAVFIYAVPLEKMKGELAVGSLAASHLFGPGVAGVFAALMALSLVSTVNAMVTIGPRLYYAMARNGAFVSAAARVDERWHTPVFAIVCQGACAILMTLTPFPQLVYYIGFTLNFFAAVTVCSIFVLRRQPGWQKLKVVDFAWPLVPAAFVLIAGAVVIVGVTLAPKVALAAVITIVSGAIVYRLRSSGGGASRQMAGAD